MFVQLVSLAIIVSQIGCQYPETSQELDYSDNGGRTLGTNSGPTLLNPNQELKGFEPIYVSPDLEDILDRQEFNVYHEPVHGSILMPRISFALNDDDKPMKEEDYDDYMNLVAGVDPKFYSRKRNRKRGSLGGGCGPGCVPRAQSMGRSSVQMFPNPMYNPTIEEMIPYAKIKDTPDTYIVMADDPVLAVDSVPKCSKNANKGGDEAGKGRSLDPGADGGSSTEGGVDVATAPTEGGGGESSTAAADGGESSTAGGGDSTTPATGASEGSTTPGRSTTPGGKAETSTRAEERRRRRKRRSVVFKALFERK